MWTIIRDLSYWLTLFWPLSHSFYGYHKLFKWYFHEMKPFFPVLCIIEIVFDKPTFWNYLWLAFVLWYWNVIKNDHNDDDRWNRRKRKVSETIKSLNGKLVPVPVKT